MDITERLNILGVVSLLGGDIAVSALHYLLLSRNNILVYAYLSSGLQTVSSKLFKRMPDHLSKAISPGHRDDPKSIFGLSTVNNFKYIGLHSGTSMNIRSALGESILRTCQTPTTEIQQPNRGVGRGIKFTLIELGDVQSHESPVPIVHVPSIPVRILHSIIPVISILSIVGLILLRDYVVMAVVILNIIANICIVVSTRGNGCFYPIGHASKGSPRGDILVEDVSSDGDLWLVLGHEDAIQYLFQRSVILHNDHWSRYNFGSACLAFIVTIVNIIALSFGTWYGQVGFAGLLLLGCIQNIMLATFDGDTLLCTLADTLVPIKHYVTYRFDNRSTALVYAMIRSQSTNINALKTQVPNTETWHRWCEEVGRLDIDTFSSTSNDRLLNDLYTDIQHAITIYKRLNYINSPKT